MNVLSRTLWTKRDNVNKYVGLHDMFAVFMFAVCTFSGGVDGAVTGILRARCDVFFVHSIFSSSAA